LIFICARGKSLIYKPKFVKGCNIYIFHSWSSSESMVLSLLCAFSHPIAFLFLPTLIHFAEGHWKILAPFLWQSTLPLVNRDLGKSNTKNWDKDRRGVLMPSSSYYLTLTLVPSTSSYLIVLCLFSPATRHTADTPWLSMDRLIDRKRRKTCE
jgi:hypothetical protein